MNDAARSLWMETPARRPVRARNVMARGWKHRIKLRHLLTDKEDHASLQASMNAIADALQGKPEWVAFRSSDFRTLPEGDHIMRPVDYANRLLDRMYDYADEHRIWIEPSWGE